MIGLNDFQYFTKMCQNTPQLFCGERGRGNDLIITSTLIFPIKGEERFSENGMPRNSAAWSFSVVFTGKLNMRTKETMGSLFWIGVGLFFCAGAFEVRAL